MASTKRRPIDLSEPHNLWVWALVGLVCALFFWWAVTATTTTEERMNLYDSMGKSTNIRWR